MSHSFFCIKEYTNKQDSNGLFFLILNTNYKSTQWSSLWRLFVVLFMSTLIDFSVT